MLIDFNQLLQILLYAGLIVLVIIFIILGIRLIRTLDKVDKLLDDVNDKMTKVNGVFDLIDKTTDFAAGFSDKIISGITRFINLIFRKKKGSDEDE